MRRIEWNVTARTGVPHVRVELAERVLVTWLVLDLSASMAFGTGDRRKADVAEGVAVAVGYAATRRGNRLGTVTFGDESTVEPPRQGRRALLHTLRTLREVPPGGSGSLRDALELADRVATPARARPRRLRLPRPAQLARAAAAARRPAHRAGGRGARPARAGARRRRRAAPRRSRRPAASCASTPAIGACASDSPSAASEERRALAASLATAGVGHVALSTEGDWLRPLAAFLRQRQANQVSFTAPILLLCLLAVPAAVALYVWLDDRRDARAVRVGAGAAPRQHGRAAARVAPSRADDPAAGRR